MSNVHTSLISQKRIRQIRQTKLKIDIFLPISSWFLEKKSPVSKETIPFKNRGVRFEYSKQQQNLHA